MNLPKQFMLCIPKQEGKQYLRIRLKLQPYNKIMNNLTLFSPDSIIEYLTSIVCALNLYKILVKNYQIVTFHSSRDQTYVLNIPAEQVLSRPTIAFLTPIENIYLQGCLKTQSFIALSSLPRYERCQPLLQGGKWEDYISYKTISDPLQ